MCNQSRARKQDANETAEKRGSFAVIVQFFTHRLKAYLHAMKCLRVKIRQVCFVTFKTRLLTSY